MTSKFNTKRFEGQVAVLTASSTGIGFATAERLAHEGARVVLSSRSEENVQEAMQKLIDGGIPAENVGGIVCHVANAEHRQRLIDYALERFGQIDILFHNAGINPAVGEVMDITGVQFDKLVEVNVKAPFLLSKLAIPHMTKRGHGCIIFNGTVSAYTNYKGITTYGMVKLALASLTKALSKELSPYGIRVNCVAPGLIQTEMGRIMWDKNHKRSKDVASGIPSWMPRYGQPEDVAAAVAYLASDDASFVTGETHIVSGGIDSRL